MLLLLCCSRCCDKLWGADYASSAPPCPRVPVRQGRVVGADRVKLELDMSESPRLTLATGMEPNVRLSMEACAITAGFWGELTSLQTWVARHPYDVQLN